MKLNSQLLRSDDHTQQEVASARALPSAELGDTSSHGPSWEKVRAVSLDP